MSNEDQIALIVHNRFSLTSDMNLDGVVTISDVWLWFKWLFFYPGDYLLFIQITVFPTSWAQFWELSFTWFGGWWAGIFSFFVWMMILIGISEGVREIKEGEGIGMREIFGERKTGWIIFSLLVFFVLVVILFVGR